MMGGLRVIHAAVRGLTPKQATDAFYHSIHQSVFLNRHNHVRGTSGFKPTASSHVQGGKRFVTKHRADGETFQKKVTYDACRRIKYPWGKGQVLQG